MGDPCSFDTTAVTYSNTESHHSMHPPRFNTQSNLPAHRPPLLVPQVYSNEQSTVIAGLATLEDGAGDYFAMPSVGEAEVDLEGLRELDQAMAAAAIADSDDEGADAMDQADPAAIAAAVATAPVKCALTGLPV